MPFIGNQPALSFTSFAKQDFTTSATTSYTLDHKVANENELALFINFVRQEAGTAYTASNNTLTLSSATSASDDMYAIFLGKAIQTVTPPNNSVGTSQLVDGAVTPSKQSALANPFASQLLHVRDEKDNQTHGGTNIGGVNTRTLNTIKTNEITGASLSSNQITLPTGTYYIDASAPFYATGYNHIYLYNVTDSSNEVYGANLFSNDTADSGRPFLKGRFTIASQKVFELRHYAHTVVNNLGLGLMTTYNSIPSTYAEVQIWRTA